MRPRARCVWSRFSRVALCLVLAMGSGCSLKQDGTGAKDRDEAPVEVDAGGRDEDGSIVNTPDGLLRDAGPAKTSDAARPDASTTLVDATTPRGDAATDAGDVIDASIGDASLADGGLPDGAALDASATDAGQPDAAGSDGGVVGGSCGFAGVYALRMDFDVDWQGTKLNDAIPVIGPGSGVLTMWSSLVASENESGGTGSIDAVGCGTKIPDFQAGENIYKGETYGVYVPDASWDSPLLPHWKLGYKASCREIGCTFSADPLLALLGARNTPPVPPATTPGLEVVDHDGDGKPAMTLIVRGPSELTSSGKPYAYPPLFAPWVRARKLQLAIGVYAQLEGGLTACDTIAGTVRGPVVQQGAVGCSGIVQGDPVEKECTSEFVEFIDENLPAWTVKSARFTAKRVASPACKVVRAALP